MRIINFESGDYYERAGAPKKNKKGKKSRTVVVQDHGTRWYTGNGNPDKLPRSEWTPNAEINPPRDGDFYLDVLTNAWGRYNSAGTGEAWRGGR